VLAYLMLFGGDRYQVTAHFQNAGQLVKGNQVVVGGSKKGPFLGPIKRVAWSKLVGGFIEPRIKFFIAQFNKEDMQFLADLASAGKLRTVIDRRYPLEQTGAALAYLGEGHARAKVIVDLD